MVDTAERYSCIDIWIVLLAGCGVNATGLITLDRGDDAQADGIERGRFDTTVFMALLE